MKTIFHLVPISILMATFLSCQQDRHASSDQSVASSQILENEIVVTKSQFEASKMKLGKVTQHIFTKTVQANGYLEVPPAKHVKIYAVKGGYIQKINLLEGNKVKKGDFLLSLTNPDYIALQQQYLEVNEQLKYLKSEYERQKTLADERIAARKNFVKATSEYKSTLATYEGLKQQLQLLNIDPAQLEAGNIQPAIKIYAPISGYISNVQATQGSFMSASDLILEIINTDNLHLELQVFEKDVLMVRPGNSVHFKIPETGDQIFKGEVHLVGKSVNEDTRTILVHGDISQNYAQLIRGMYVEAEIITDTLTALALENNAVVEDGETKFALIYSETRADSMIFRKYQLNTGLNDNLMTQVLNPDQFKDDTQILVDGAFNLIGIN